MLHNFRNETSLMNNDIQHSSSMNGSCLTLYCSTVLACFSSLFNIRQLSVISPRCYTPVSCYVLRLYTCVDIALLFFLPLQDYWVSRKSLYWVLFESLYIFFLFISLCALVFMFSVCIGFSGLTPFPYLADVDFGLPPFSDLPFDPCLDFVFESACCSQLVPFPPHTPFTNRNILSDFLTSCFTRV